MKPILVFLARLSIVSSLLLGTILQWSTLTGQSEEKVVRWTERVSIASDGAEGNRESSGAAISADGRYIAFESDASNLVAGDTNTLRDIFVRDRQTGTTERVSVASDGTEGSSHGTYGILAISADGRYVAFSSGSSTMVAGDTNLLQDVFVHDRQTGITERVSIASDGTEGNSVSLNPAISADGRYVAFGSVASNLVAGDTNSIKDIFVHDRQTDITERVSDVSSGTEGFDFSCCSAISADGRYVAFSSSASDLVEGDSNDEFDVFVHDRQTGTTERVSVASDGTEGNDVSCCKVAISADGRHIAFRSAASNLVNGDTTCCSGDIFVHDRQTGITVRVSVASDGTEANSSSTATAISADGRYVAFSSGASNLVAGDTNGWTDAFLHNLQTGITVRVSVASDGTEATIPSKPAVVSNVAISADGQCVSFSSGASNLVNGDTNGWGDVFVHCRYIVDQFLFLPILSAP